MTLEVAAEVHIPVLLAVHTHLWPQVLQRNENILHTVPMLMRALACAVADFVSGCVFRVGMASPKRVLTQYMMDGMYVQ